ncbi:helicase [Beggiatoa sp. PS]|nr:helicase [Beggiatoa sp. PS]
MPTREKGPIFEWYLAELYQGNGWLTKIQGGRGDLGADILLYHPKTPHQVSLIVQAKNHATPLTFDQTKIELVKFEQQAASKYDCQQFNLVAVNGFVKEARKLSEFNLLLSDWPYIAHLIEHFDPENIIEPEIELFAHNQNAYEQVKALWQDNKYVAVVQATGTGKSFIIAQVMADFMGENQLLMAPSHYILEQQQTKVPWATPSTQFMTYAKGANLSDKEIYDLQAKLIILDEFHRCGAEVWGAGVQKILEAHPDAYVLGTTATPIRYLDSSRDMSDELFDGVVAVDLSLADAIVKRILPAPTYIAALYTLSEEINHALELLKNSNQSNEEKQAIAVDINQAKLDWERTSGIPEILKKHLTSDINKLMVFCKNQEHLDNMEIEVQRWFQQAKIHKRRKIYRVLSADPESDQNLTAFKQAQSKNTAHLLFAIDMLNEGLHIADVGAVILLRPTESPIIFYQQIGRCLQVDVEHTPIIFDFVNNFRSIRANDFLVGVCRMRWIVNKRKGQSWV